MSHSQLLRRTLLVAAVAFLALAPLFADHPASADLSRGERGAPRGESAPPATGGSVDTLTAPKAIVLGVIEGLTEYLPISSTGHLLVAEKILGVGQTEADKDVTDTYTVVIQIGAILAVLGLYRRRFATMVDGMLGRSRAGRDLLVTLVVAFIPAALMAELFGDAIKDKLLRPWPVVVAWVVGAIAIFVLVANQSRLRVTVTDVAAIGWHRAAAIGLMQVIALWPGTSRSFVTILGALLIGASLSAAVEFSFLLGFVTLSAATGYELVKNGEAMFEAFGWFNPLLGIVVAGISAVVSVKWMVAYLQRRPLTIFGWYRVGAAVLVGALLLTGAL